MTVSAAPARIAILLSGRGSNMLALADGVRAGRIPGEIGLVLSNVPEAVGLRVAAERGLPTAALDHRGRTRAEHDAAVVAALEAADVSLICLAGYMRILSAAFVQRFAGRILNVHPSLLPSFPGLDAQRQALEHGVRVSGCTVHLVDEQLDHGPIVLQEAVPVLPDDTEQSLSARILAAEHRIYPEAVALMAAGRVRIEGRRAHLI